MKLRFAKQKSWKGMGFLWLVVAVMTTWLGTARTQLMGFTWIEALSYATSVLSICLCVYFWNLNRVVLFSFDESGVSAHEGLARKRRILSWELISYVRWEEDTCVFVKHDGNAEGWKYDLLTTEDQLRFKQELAKNKPVYEKA